MRRIICIGNRLVPEDSAGPEIHDFLAGIPLPLDVELVDGGTAGLDLLRYVRGADRVVFVDAVTGFDRAEPVFLLDAGEAAACGGDEYGHDAGLTYLLRVIESLEAGHAAEIVVVAVQGLPDRETVLAAAEMSLAAATRDERCP
jgi:hydrogenase maturation protease